MGKLQIYFSKYRWYQSEHIVKAILSVGLYIAILATNVSCGLFVFSSICILVILIALYFTFVIRVNRVYDNYLDDQRFDSIMKGYSDRIKRDFYCAVNGCAHDSKINFGVINPPGV
jgi:hypothetical protein